MANQLFLDERLLANSDGILINHDRSLKDNIVKFMKAYYSRLVTNSKDMLCLYDQNAAYCFHNLLEAHGRESIQRELKRLILKNCRFKIREVTIENISGGQIHLRTNGVMEHPCPPTRLFVHFIKTKELSMRYNVITFDKLFFQPVTRPEDDDNGSGLLAVSRNVETFLATLHPYELVVPITNTLCSPMVQAFWHSLAIPPSENLCYYITNINYEFDVLCVSMAAIANAATIVAQRKRKCWLDHADALTVLNYLWRVFCPNCDLFVKYYDAFRNAVQLFQQNEREIFVGRIPDNVTANVLCQCFSAYGIVRRVTVLPRKDMQLFAPNCSHPFFYGFVEFGTEAAVKRCLESVPVKIASPFNSTFLVQKKSWFLGLVGMHVESHRTNLHAQHSKSWVSANEFNFFSQVNYGYHDGMSCYDFFRCIVLADTTVSNPCMATPRQNIPLPRRQSDHLSSRLFNNHTPFSFPRMESPSAANTVTMDNIGAAGDMFSLPEHQSTINTLPPTLTEVGDNATLGYAANTKKPVEHSISLDSQGQRTVPTRIGRDRNQFGNVSDAVLDARSRKNLHYIVYPLTAYAENEISPAAFTQNEQTANQNGQATQGRSNYPVSFLQASAYPSPLQYNREYQAGIHPLEHSMWELPPYAIPTVRNIADYEMTRTFREIDQAAMASGQLLGSSAMPYQVPVRSDVWSRTTSQISSILARYAELVSQTLNDNSTTVTLESFDSMDDSVDCCDPEMSASIPEAEQAATPSNREESSFISETVTQSAEADLVSTFAACADAEGEALDKKFAITNLPMDLNEEKQPQTSIATQQEEDTKETEPVNCPNPDYMLVPPPPRNFDSPPPAVSVGQEGEVPLENKLDTVDQVFYASNDGATRNDNRPVVAANMISAAADKPTSDDANQIQDDPLTNTNANAESGDCSFSLSKIDYPTLLESARMKNSDNAPSSSGASAAPHLKNNANDNDDNLYRNYRFEKPGLLRLVENKDCLPYELSGNKFSENTKPANQTTAYEAGDCPIRVKLLNEFLQPAKVPKPKGRKQQQQQRKGKAPLQSRTQQMPSSEDQLP